MPHIPKEVWDSLDRHIAQLREQERDARFEGERQAYEWMIDEEDSRNGADLTLSPGVGSGG